MSSNFVIQDLVHSAETARERAPCMTRTPPSSSAAASHNKGRFWSAAEDDLLVHTLNRMPPRAGGGRDWRAIADVFVSAGYDRTTTMLRNREMRIAKNKQPLKNGGRRNRCTACGEIRAGHTCRAKLVVGLGDTAKFLPPLVRAAPRGAGECEPCEPAEPRSPRSPSTPPAPSTPPTVARLPSLPAVPSLPPLFTFDLFVPVESPAPPSKAVIDEASLTDFADADLWDSLDLFEL